MAVNCRWISIRTTNNLALEFQEHGRLSSIRMLVEAGANINHTDLRGEKASDWAERLGHMQAVNMLEHFGAAGGQRWHRRDNGGANWGQGNHDDDLCVEAMNGDLDRMKEMIRDGTDISVALQVWRPGASALYLAARGGHEGGKLEKDGHVECVRYLLQACPRQVSKIPPF